MSKNGSDKLFVLVKQYENKLSSMTAKEIRAFARRHNITNKGTFDYFVNMLYSVGINYGNLKKVEDDKQIKLPLVNPSALLNLMEN